MLIILFLVLVVTGVLLMYFFEPHESQAWESIRGMEERVRYGALLRAVHNVSGQLMLVFVIVHVISLVWRRAYERRKLANWLIGVALLVLTVARFADRTGTVYGGPIAPDEAVNAPKSPPDQVLDAAVAWLGVDNMRMLAPVKIGDTITVVVEVLDKQPTKKPDRGIQVWRYTVKNQRREDVMVLDYKMMFHMRG